MEKRGIGLGFAEEERMGWGGGGGVGWGRERERESAIVFVWGKKRHQGRECVTYWYAPLTPNKNAAGKLQVSELTSRASLIGLWYEGTACGSVVVGPTGS